MIIEARAEAVVAALLNSEVIPGRPNTSRQIVLRHLRAVVAQTWKEAAEEAESMAPTEALRIIARCYRQHAEELEQEPTP